MSKGSKQRPLSVPVETFESNFDAIFGKKKGTCGCGRSPTGNCIGWHGLTEDAYKKALSEYKK